MISRPHDMPAAFASAYNSGDVEALLKLYADDAVFLPDGVTEVSGDGIRQALEGFLKLKGPMKMELKRAVEGPDAAVVVAAWSLPTPDGQTLTGTTSDVLKKQADGGWRYSIDAPFGVKA
ncbi:MAG: SgcJ/EcaC family oxidoreductase [Myxococcaceae bacterium]